MSHCSVLIVEDEPFTALDMEQALEVAGWAVCGVAASEARALDLARQTRPEFAVVDIRLSPGDGRVVAGELTRCYGTSVLIASANCDDYADLARTGAMACLPKPYNPADIPAALVAMESMRCGRPPGAVPDHMHTLRQTSAVRGGPTLPG
jgi:DNA-binding response OmpR family regulator